MEYILVGAGGIFGSLARFIIGRFVAQRTGSTLPVGTFIVNTTGAFLLGIISSIGIGSNSYLLLADGFLGAYTTFSTFMYEGFNLFQENEKLNAFIYILFSLFLGILGFITGVGIGKLII